MVKTISGKFDRPIERSMSAMSDSSDEDSSGDISDYSASPDNDSTFEESDYDAAEEIATLHKDNEQSLGDLMMLYDDLPTEPPTQAGCYMGGHCESSSSNVNEMLDKCVDMDDDTDSEYEPKMEPPPSSRVGVEFQAELPDVQPSDQDRALMTEPQVVFNFSQMEESQLDGLLDAYQTLLTQRKNPISRGNKFRLFTLYWSFNLNQQKTIDFLADELEKHYPDDVQYSDLQLAMYAFHPDRPWSDDEISGFEAGLKMFGKDFHKIRSEMLPKRSLSEVLDFYYVFKTTDRYHQLDEELKRKNHVDPCTVNKGEPSAAGETGPPEKKINWLGEPHSGARKLLDDLEKRDETDMVPRNGEQLAATTPLLLDGGSATPDEASSR